jgi:hypothetical protein
MLTVYCLGVVVSWNGRDLRAGRLPRYGVEVRNIRTAAGARPRRSTAFSLTGTPLLHLERLFEHSPSSIFVVTEPNVPLESGQLKVRIELAPCPERVARRRADLACSAAQASRKVRFVAPRVRGTTASGLGLEVEYRDLHVDTLSPRSPVEHTFQLPPYKRSPHPTLPERAIIVARDNDQALRLTVSRPENQSWTFDWREAPLPEPE